VRDARVPDDRACITGDHRAAQAAGVRTLHKPSPGAGSWCWGTPLPPARLRPWTFRSVSLMLLVGVSHTGDFVFAFSNAKIVGQIPRTPWFTLRINGSEIRDHSLVSAVRLVATRFCLGQGNSTYLVAARLELFKAVCLPSMAQQRLSASFLWVIYVDSTLALGPLADLQRVLKPYPLFILVRLEGPDVEKPLLLPVSSTLRMLGMRGKPAPGRKPLFISSRIDADDGLARGTICHIQLIAGARAKSLALKALEAPLLTANRRPTGGNHFPSEPLRGIICWRESVWWAPTQYFKAARNGFGGLTFTIDHGLHGLENGCITPGLTAFSWDERAPSVHVGHHRYIATLNTTSIFLVQQGNKEILSPIRARTVTSNSMDGVATFRASMAPTLDVLESTYNVSRDVLLQCAGELRRIAPLVAADQLAQRCRPGFSCSSGAGSLLKRIAVSVPRSPASKMARKVQLHRN